MGKFHTFVKFYGCLFGKSSTIILNLQISDSYLRY